MKFSDHQFNALKEEIKPLLNSRVRNKKLRQENYEAGLKAIQNALASGLTWESAFEVKEGVGERLVDVLFKWEVEVEVLEQLSIPKIDMKTPYQQKSRPGQTWFHGAVQKNDLNLFKYLVENQFNGTWTNDKGQNPAFFLVSEKFYKFFKKEMPILFEEVDNNMTLPAEYWIKNEKKSNTSIFALDFIKNNRDLLPIDLVCEALVKSIDSNYYKIQEKFKTLFKNYEEEYLNKAVKINGVALPGFEHNIRNISRTHEFNAQTLRLLFNSKDSLFKALDLSKKQHWDSDVKNLWDFFNYVEEFRKNNYKKQEPKSGKQPDEEPSASPDEIALKIIQQMNLVTAARKTIDRLHNEFGMKKETNYSLIEIEATLVMVSFLSLTYFSGTGSLYSGESMSSFLPGFREKEGIAGLNLWQHPEVARFVKNNINKKVMGAYAQLNTEPFYIFNAAIKDEKIKAIVFENALTGLAEVVKAMDGYVPDDNKFRGTESKGLRLNQNELLACIVFSTLDSDVVSVIENKKMMSNPEFKKNIEMLVDLEKVLAFGKNYKEYMQYGVCDDFDEDPGKKYFKVSELIANHLGTPQFIENLLLKFELSQNIKTLKKEEGWVAPKIERF